MKELIRVQLDLSRAFSKSERKTVIPMHNLNAAAKRYLRQVRSWLPCSQKLKNRIMGQIQSSVSAYAEQTPGADFDQLQTHFGTPRQIASAYVESMGTDTLLRDLRIRRKLVSIVTGTMAAVLAVWMFAVGWAMYEDWKNEHGRLVDTWTNTIIEPER